MLYVKTDTKNRNDSSGCLTSIFVIHLRTVGTGSIQTPLHFSIVVIFQPFSKIV